MNPFLKIWLKLRSLGQRQGVKQEIDEELRFHLEQRTAENIATGMSPDDAARAARKRFGNFQSVREDCREVRGANLGESILQDVRFGARMLRKNPGFTSIAILTLALGIGANTAIFSFINAILLQPLPYPGSDRLVISTINATVPDYYSWKDECRSFTRVAAYRPVFYSFPGNPFPERIKGVRSSPNLFSMLQVHPIHGRDFREEEEYRDSNRAMILGYELWHRRFGGETNIVGKGVSIGGDPFTIIGVAPPDFDFPNGSEFWTSVEFDRNKQGGAPGSGLGFRVLGMLAPETVVQQANAELNAIAERKAKDQLAPKIHGGVFAPLREDMVGKVRPTLLLLLGASGMVLLIACANIANLLLARAVTRGREIAIRCAVGAGPRRICQQLLAESMFLALLGGAAGVLLALALTKFFLLIAPANVPRLQEVKLDQAVLGFSVLLSLLCGVLFGLLPALQAARINLLGILNDGGKGIRTGGHGTRKVFVTVQIALAVVLLTGAALLVQSLVRLQRIDPGFNPKNLALVPLAGDCEFRWSLLERLRAVPGDVSFGIVDYVPCAGPAGGTRFRLENDLPGTEKSVRANSCSAGYFKTMGIPIIAGREFERYEHRAIGQDSPSSARVVVVNDIFAKRYFGDENPIGKRILIGTNAPLIVGVAKANRYLLGQEAAPEVFSNFPQNCGMRPLTLTVRSHADLKTVMAMVRHEARFVNPDLSVGDGTTMELLMAQTLAQQKFQMMLLSGLSLTALVLAMVGIYGVLAYRVTQRTQELGVRMALGAQRPQILWLVLRQGMRLALLGVGIGALAAIGLSRFIKSFLFEVRPTDPFTFIGVILLLLLMALFACWLPARRATQVDPLVALRYE